MATYDYKCEDCDTIREVGHSMMEQPLVHCRKCLGVMHKHFTADSCNIQKHGDGKTMTHWEEVKYRK